MCKELLNNIEELDEYECEECTCDKEEKEPVYYSEEEIVDIVEECVAQIIPKVVVDFEPVQGIDVYDNGFIDGVNDASYLCGFYSTLVSAGMSPKDAYELCLNQSTAMANERLAALQNQQTAITTMQNSI